MQAKTITAIGLFMLLIIQLHAKVHLHVKNNKIYDENGGQRIFHGVNLVIKSPPYYDTQFGEKNLINLKALGINGIRLGVMWPGVQPKRDVYDDSYLKRMVDLVNLAGSYNIYTLVEFHQDLYSEKFCGDGVPLWAIPKQIYQSFPIPLMKQKAHFDNETGLPNAQACKLPWAQYYFSRAVNLAFGHFWKNKGGLLDKFAAYWRKVASAFKDNPYVIAYQLMNEPWPGNFYEDPIMMIPGLSQKPHMQDSYDYLSRQIRKVDPDHNICFEPVTWLNGIQSGFTHPPGGRRFSNSSIFCYHYYNPPTLNLDGFMKARLKDIKRLNTGGLLSEFFIEGQEGKRNVLMMDACDKHSHSWFGWIYKQKMIDQIKRTFSHRVGGTIISQSFNHITKEYQLMFHANKNAGKTIIYLDTKQDYAGGFDVHIYPSYPNVRYNLVDEIYLEIQSDQFEDGITVLIAISP